MWGGHPVDLWSTGCDAGLGSPTSAQWCPKACDTSLQQINKWGWGTWFWMEGFPLRPMNQLISVYHDTVGRGGVLELDFAIDRDGLVHPDHAQLYKQFGDWIRAS